MVFVGQKKLSFCQGRGQCASEWTEQGLEGHISF